MFVFFLLFNERSLHICKRERERDFVPVWKMIYSCVLSNNRLSLINKLLKLIIYHHLSCGIFKQEYSSKEPVKFILFFQCRFLHRSGDGGFRLFIWIPNFSSSVMNHKNYSLIHIKMNMEYLNSFWYYELQSYFKWILFCFIMV